MKILGTSQGLTGTTRFASATAVWVANTNTTTAKTVTLRNSEDNADLGTLVVPAGGGVVIHKEPGQGVRGETGLSGVPVDAASGR